MRFLGLPWPVWGVGCLIVAAIYTVVWPQNAAAQPIESWHFLVLRWAHPLVWALLAASCFIRSTRFGGVANTVAVLGGIIYAVFLATVIVAAQR